MAILRAKQLREMSEDELKAKLSEYRAELRKLESHIKAGVRPENPGSSMPLRANNEATATNTVHTSGMLKR
jgi:ribosomal protein L29